MYCYSCGNETPDESINCMHCGTQVNKECPRCAEIIKLKARYCRFCGYEIVVNDSNQLEETEWQNLLDQLINKKIDTETKPNFDIDSKIANHKQSDLREDLRKEEELASSFEAEKSDFESWHPRHIVTTWGEVVYECSTCGAINSMSLTTCRRCSTNLKTAKKVNNPYL